MKFKIQSYGRFDAEVIDEDVRKYFTDYIRFPGDSIELASMSATVDISIERYVWCRPCDVKALYGNNGGESKLISYEQDNLEHSVTYIHNNTKDQLTLYGQTLYPVDICLITTSDYVMNIANGYFRTLGRGSNNAKSFMWLRENTIEDAKYKKWSNNDLASGFSDLACLMEVIGTRDDTYSCLRTRDNQIIEASNEGVRKARKRKSPFTM